MDTDVAYFAINPRPDRSPCELVYLLDEPPGLLEELNATEGYYRGEVGFELIHHTDVTEIAGYTLRIELYPHVNPTYDETVRELVGDSLANYIQNREESDEGAVRDSAMADRNGSDGTTVLESLLNEALQDEDTHAILSRLIKGSIVL